MPRNLDLALFTPEVADALDVLATETVNGKLNLKSSLVPIFLRHLNSTDLPTPVWRELGELTQSDKDAFMSLAKHLDAYASGSITPEFAPDLTEAQSIGRDLERSVGREVLGKLGLVFGTSRQSSWLGKTQPTTPAAVMAPSLEQLRRVRWQVASGKTREMPMTPAFIDSIPEGSGVKVGEYQGMDIFITSEADGRHAVVEVGNRQSRRLVDGITAHEVVVLQSVEGRNLNRLASQSEAVYSSAAFVPRPVEYETLAPSPSGAPSAADELREDQLKDVMEQLRAELAERSRQEVERGGEP